MKIVLYGTCSYPFFYREVVKLAQEQKRPVEWRVLLYSWRHVELFQGVLPDSAVTYVYEPLNELMKTTRVDLSPLKDYPGSLFEDIMADKEEPGQLRTKDKTYQLRNALAFHKFYTDYLTREKPDYVYFPMIETHEGKILFNLCRQMNIPTLYSLNTRNLGISYFAVNPEEELPAYARALVPAPETVARARKLVDDFKIKPLPDLNFVTEPVDVDVPFQKRTPFLLRLATRAPVALWNIVQDLTREPHAPRSNPFWYQPRVEFHAITYGLRRLKGTLRKRYFDIFRIAELPEKFVYFPLHFQPEASINARAPYFIDQLRAVDLLLENIPSDHFLVVKEHPAMKGIRPASFYKEFKRRAGVLLVDYDVPGIEMVKRAALTVTVTGTAALEALMLGRPAFMLGKTFFAPWVAGIDPALGIRASLRKALKEDAAAITARAVDCAATMLSIGYNFALLDPYDPGVDPKYTMNKQNVACFLDALFDHIAKSGKDPR